MVDQTNEAEKAAALPPRQPHKSKRRWLICVGCLIAIVVLALALGLGLGLGLRRGGSGSSGTQPTSTSIPSSAPAPSGVYQPPVNASWQIILKPTLIIDHNNPSVEPDVDVFDIDMFLHQNNTVIADLHTLDKKVICYFSAGSYEPGRPDSYRFQASDKGRELDGWPGEYWLNLKSPNVRDIMRSRMDIAQQIGCDAVDPDNVDGYQNDNGLGLSSDDSINYVQFLTSEAHSRKLGIGLKNAGDIISDVINSVQFSVNEQCAQYNECDTFAPFIQAGKPVFHIEYPSDAGTAQGVSAVLRTNDCQSANSSDFSTVIKTMDLNGWVQYCNGQTADTDTTS